MTDAKITEDDYFMYAMMLVGVSLIVSYILCKKNLNKLSLDQNSGMSNALTGILVLGVAFFMGSIATYACAKKSDTGLTLNNYMVIMFLIALTGIILYTVAVNDKSFKKQENAKAVSNIKNTLTYFVLLPSIVAMLASMYHFYSEWKEKQEKKGKTEKQQAFEFNF